MILALRTVISLADGHPPDASRDLAMNRRLARGIAAAIGIAPKSWPNGGVAEQLRRDRLVPSSSSLASADVSFTAPFLYRKWRSGETSRDRKGQAQEPFIGFLLSLGFIAPRGRSGS